MFLLSLCPDFLSVGKFYFFHNHFEQGRLKGFSISSLGCSHLLLPFTSPVLCLPSLPPPLLSQLSVSRIHLHLRQYLFLAVCCSCNHEVILLSPLLKKIIVKNQAKNGLSHQLVNNGGRFNSHLSGSKIHVTMLFI